MDPLQLDVDIGRVLLVHRRLDEALRLAHLADPGLDGHKFVASAQVNLSKLVIVAEITTTTLHFLDLGSDLGLFLGLPLGLGALPSLFSDVRTVLLKALVDCATSEFRLLLGIIIHLLGRRGSLSPHPEMLLIIIVDVCVPHHDCLVVAAR